MAPERKSDFAAVVFRAFISGSVACFLTACVAGTLYDQRAGYSSLFQDSLKTWKLERVIIVHHKYWYNTAHDDDNDDDDLIKHI